MFVLGLHDKDRKYSRDKVHMGNPKVNKCCSPLTASHTSADCMNFTPGPLIQHISLGVYNTGGGGGGGGFNAMKFKAIVSVIPRKRADFSTTCMPLITDYIHIKRWGLIILVLTTTRCTITTVGDRGGGGGGFNAMKFKAIVSVIPRKRADFSTTCMPLITDYIHIKRWGLIILVLTTTRCTITTVGDRALMSS